ncbi:MAG TPA: class I SAM-dependent methyltransferase [Syntrophobacteraceae bacterium]|nr:class I SAM-dependent methyltransferase [Syntrophobacteraceae bacterium]
MDYKRRLLKEATKHLFKRKPQSYKAILLDYPIYPTPRYGYGRDPHNRLINILNNNRHRYIELLNTLTTFHSCIERIPYTMSNNIDPFWNNGYFPALDALALYCVITAMKPKHYIEIGSGNSTKFAKKAIKDFGLNTEMICIDPKPRAEIKNIADKIIYCQCEMADLSIFSRLEPNDILFIDGSHRCFMNSDVTTVFLDIIPELKSGVLIHFHDIYLPYDYPPEMKEFFYSEQYLLAVMLLSMPQPDVLFPAFFIQNDRELMNILKPVTEALSRTGFHGGSFWMRKSDPWAGNPAKS